jgi:uncharacterized membrane protein
LWRSAIRLQHSIEIAAPINVVWAANEDVERWPELAPSMEQVERLDDGALVVGSRARIKQPRLPAAEWVVTALDRRRSFSWESRSFGMRTVATPVSPLVNSVKNDDAACIETVEYALPV